MKYGRNRVVDKGHDLLPMAEYAGWAFDVMGELACGWHKSPIANSNKFATDLKIKGTAESKLIDSSEKKSNFFTIPGFSCIINDFLGNTIHFFQSL